MLLGLTAIYAVTTAVLFVAVPVRVWSVRPIAAPQLQASAWLAAAIFALQLPSTLVHGMYYDPTALMAEDMPLPMANLHASRVAAVWLAVTLGTSVTFALWRLGVVPAAESLGPRPAFPWLTGRAPLQVGTATLIGGLTAAVSVAVFVALGVTAHDGVRDAAILFPGLPDHWALKLGLGASTAVATAISEELLFRALLQRGLTAWLGVAPAIALTAAVWACGHALSTDTPVIKLSQIAVLGIVFGLLAHRRSVEASIAAHVVHNLIATAAETSGWP